jgi:glycosyltransferase involved in cell wall biosynthesis
MYNPAISKAAAKARSGQGSKMLGDRKVVVVLPAFNAERTLERTYRAIPHHIVDEVILVDDRSTDATLALARELGIQHIHGHPTNRGYGANQKTCYRVALERGADIVVMLHPDYQYEPRLVAAMAGMIASDVYGFVLGSRILSSGATGALAGGMPVYKYVANRMLTAFQNLLVGAKLSEFHSGFRAFSRTTLTRLPVLANANDFAFDNQMIVQAIALKVPIGEISCPTKYLPESSSIKFAAGIRYGLSVLGISVAFREWRLGIARPKYLDFATHNCLPEAMPASVVAVVANPV